jgi:uncharacterized protein involved in outer membrane biogenesis
VKFFRSRRGLAALGVLLLVALFLVRPGATSLKFRIANSIGMALQHDVEIDRVRLRLLPQPGFELENFVVHDDPSFGAEPVLRSQEVSANLRLSALLRGKLEISRLSLIEPSLNLTRNDSGRWNIEQLLERTARMTVAPTGTVRAQSRAAFPYIEAERGRINFKLGAEKKSFALTDARYAFWQDSENTWGMRLRAQPLRTDFNLTDTGQIRASGTWSRAASLRETPLEFRLQWEEAQLGQLTKLLSGEDRGWRGSVHLSAELTGTPADLLVQSEASLEDFRRYDIADTDLLKLAAHCSAHYSSVDRGLHAIDCHAPTGSGDIAVTGEIVRWRAPRGYDLRVEADKVPVQAVLSAIRHAKKNVPEDLLATGKLAANFHLHASDDGSIVFEGAGQTTSIRLLSAATKSELFLDSVPFSLHTGSAAKHKLLRSSGGLKEPDGPHLVFGPVALKLGRPAPLMVGGWITRFAYDIYSEGDADLPRLLDVARLAGIPVIHPEVTGSAKLNLQLAGNWWGFVSPITTGTAQLHSVRGEVRGLNAPLEIAAASVSLGPTDTRVQAISASIAGTRWTGSLLLPRPCSSVQTCPVTFDLHADQLATDTLSQLLNPNAPKTPWYHLLAPVSQANKSFLARAQATGTLTADRLVIRNVVGMHFTAKVELEEGKLHLSQVRGDMMGGKHHGDWRASFVTRPVTYSGIGTFEGLSLGQVADTMHDEWIRGTASARYMIEMSGLTSAELANSAHGSVQFHLRDGALPHIVLAGSPLRMRRFAGSLKFGDGQVEMREATLESSNATFDVSGTATLSRNLNFKLVQEGSPALNVTGTLSEPQIAPAPAGETQVALKP